MERLFITIMAVAGVALVGIGMWRENNPLFLMGLVLVVVSYLFIRKHLKRAASKRD